MTKNQANVLAAFKQMITAKKPWLPLSALDCYDGRTVSSLVRQGKIEVNLEYGVRLICAAPL